MNVQKNQIYTVKITDMGTDGEGIGHLEETGQESNAGGALRSGYTLFVKDAVMGDTVRARIVKAKKGYAYARLEEVLEPSPDRVEPVCVYARQCGGCLPQIRKRNPDISETRPGACGSPQAPFPPYPPASWEARTGRPSA